MVRHDPDESGDIPPTAARVDSLCDQFEAAWRSGRRPRIEEVLEAGPGPWRSERLRQLLGVELAYRRRGGQTPDAEEYRRRFLEFAEIVDEAFERTSGNQGATDVLDSPDATRSITPASPVLDPQTDGSSEDGLKSAG